MPLEKNSPCKVNLILNILGKRPDGYHELETIMQPVPLHDRITFEKGGAGVVLTCNHPELPTDGKNLVFRAAEAFRQQAGIRDGVKIHLEKKIPLAAGLGGGSGNAAVTLLGLNELFGQPLSGAVLQDITASLGSDISFFLQDKPALATGRGELVESLPTFSALRGQWIVLVHPGFGISTAWSYQQLANYPAALNGQKGRAAKLAGLLQTADLKTAAREFYNSLEAPALPKYPLLALFQDFFREEGAVTLMSGSGSTTFALIEGEAAATALLEKFRSRFGANIWGVALAL